MRIQQFCKSKAIGVSSSKLQKLFRFCRHAELRSDDGYRGLGLKMLVKCGESEAYIRHANIEMA